MTTIAIFQIIAFVVCSFIAVAGALGMTTTMSMFRSGIFLMASFIGVAGLFILLSADLLGLLQIMMYIGGMLVMILFMVLFMHDPGGAMMAGMEGMAPLERWFSKGLVPRKQDGENDSADDDHVDHNAHQHGGGEQMSEHHDQSGDHQGNESDDHGSSQHGGGHCDDGMEMDMSMVTPVRWVAAWLAVAVGALLIGLLLLRPAWPLVAALPDPDSASRIGHLLMEKYMIAFEGAGFLILIGIFGAVLLARPSRYPDDPSRAGRVAVDEKPPAIEDDRLAPLMTSNADADQRAQHGQHHDQHGHHR
jgi:NADH-quinone oxidoreductase subunit J